MNTNRIYFVTAFAITLFVVRNGMTISITLGDKATSTSASSLTIGQEKEGWS